MSRVDVGARGAPGFGARLYKRVRDPVNLAILPVVAILFLLRWLDLIAAIPYWLIAGLVVVSFSVNVVNAALSADGSSQWRLELQIGFEMSAIALIIYGIGWGPILAIGFVFGAVDVMRTAGSAAARPAIIWTLICMALGQLAIAMGLAPTLVERPLALTLGGLMRWAPCSPSRCSSCSPLAGEASEGRFKALVHDASDIISWSTDPGSCST